MKKSLILTVLPIIFVVIIVVSLLGKQNETAVSSLPVNTEPTNNPPEIVTQNKIVWGKMSPGSYQRKIEPQKQTIESVSLGGQGQAILKITTSDSNVKVELKDENFQPTTNDPAVNQAIVKEPNGDTTFIFQIQSKTKTGVKDWQLVVSNPNSNSQTNYDLTISEGPPISADSTTGNTEIGINGQADLSLTLEETVALNVTVPVIEATVIATITDPNGQNTTIPLVEDPDAPGTYTGIFNDVDVPGTYEITYTITGENSAGEQFDQIVTDQFTVPDPNASEDPLSSNPTYQSIKKFDINQADDIRPVY